MQKLSALHLGVSARRILRLGVALCLAGWLLFWMFEVMSPRMEAIRAFELALRGVDTVHAQPERYCFWNGGVAWCDDNLAFMPQPGGTGDED